MHYISLLNRLWSCVLKQVSELHAFIWGERELQMAGPETEKLGDEERLSEETEGDVRYWGARFLHAFNNSSDNLVLYGMLSITVVITWCFTASQPLPLYRGAFSNSSALLNKRFSLRRSKPECRILVSVVIDGSRSLRLATLLWRELRCLKKKSPHPSPRGEA